MKIVVLAGGLSPERNVSLSTGVMVTEALRRLVEIAFHDLLLHRLEANIMPRNIPSLRVAEKVGFRSEGLSPRYLQVDGVWEDHLHMVLLNEREPE